MQDWIPFFQALVWPVFIFGFIIWFKSAVIQILNAIHDRIRSGSPFEAGPSGIKLGEGKEGASKHNLIADKDVRDVDGLPHEFYLTHKAVRDVSLDKAGKKYYRLRIAVDADKLEMLDEIEKVTYHLHPTFRDPNRTSTDRETAFEVKTAAWGEFNMTAEIFFRNGKPKLVVERYINF